MSVKIPDIRRHQPSHSKTVLRQGTHLLHSRQNILACRVKILPKRGHKHLRSILKPQRKERL